MNVVWSSKMPCYGMHQKVWVVLGGCVFCDFEPVVGGESLLFETPLWKGTEYILTLPEIDMSQLKNGKRKDHLPFPSIFRYELLPSLKLTSKKWPQKLSVFFLADEISTLFRYSQKMQRIKV